MQTLEPSGPTRLRVLTFPQQTAVPSCDGSMTCVCPVCEHERQRRVALGVRPTRGLPVKLKPAA